MTNRTFRVIGLDGGATHTRYLLADGEGRALRTGESGPSLLGAGEDRDVAERIIESARRLISEEGGSLPVDVLCGGLAGAAGRPGARHLVEQLLDEAGIARRIMVLTDSDVAFADAFGQGEGILLIAGTGSVAVGRVGHGPLRRVGGWGRLLGDEGSGYLMGLRGLKTAVRGAEGRGPATALTDSLFEALGASSVLELFEWSETATKANIASVAPRVVEQADRGDSQATKIVSETVDALVKHAEALRGQVPVEGSPPAVALVGGLVEPGGILRERVVDALAAAGFRALPEAVDPARGAVSMGLASRRP